MGGVSVIILLAFLTGVVAGFLSGLLGIGSGVLLVPASIFLLSLNFREAKALSLFVIMCTSSLGMLRHYSHGNLHAKTGVMLGVPGAAGSLTGVYLAEIFDATILKILFSFVLFFSAFRMFRDTSMRLEDDEVKNVYLLRRKMLPLVGFIGGLTAGLLGVGGGVIMVPALVFLSYPIHTAVATSLMVIFINSTTATGAHILTSELNIIQALPMTVGALLSVRKGSDMSVGLDRKRLKKVFGVFLILIGLYMLYKSLF